jgi:hypothetical protein
VSLECVELDKDDLMIVSSLPAFFGIMPTSDRSADYYFELQ